MNLWKSQWCSCGKWNSWLVIFHVSSILFFSTNKLWAKTCVIFGTKKADDINPKMWRVNITYKRETFIQLLFAKNMKFIRIFIGYSLEQIFYCKYCDVLTPHRTFITRVKNTCAKNHLIFFIKVQWYFPNEKMIKIYFIVYKRVETRQILLW